MPRKRRRLKDKRQIGLTAARKFELMHGHPGAAVLSEYERPQRGEQTDQAAAWTARREDWQEYGEALMARWLVEHPGTRPAGWWWLQSPGARRKVAGPGRVLSAPDYAVAAGRPSVMEDGRPAWHSGYIPGQADPVFEEQDVYLTRHRLWQPGERSAFNAQTKEQRNAAVSS